MQRQITVGTTDVSVTVRIVDSGDGTPEEVVTSATGGLNFWYRREGGLVVNLTESDLSAADDAHSDGGLIHLDDGYYRVDVPDAAFAAGSTGVLIGGVATGMVVIGAYIQLVAVNLNDAVRAGLTALPNAAADAAGGLPISDAGGLDLDAQIGTDIDAILVDTNALNDTKIPDTISLAAINAQVDTALADYDGPTNAEMEARTLAAAAYFDFTTDTVNLSATTEAQIDAIEADTNELQSDDVPGLIAALNDPEAGAIADAVWTEAIADHSGVSGSTAEALAAAGGAGDPWITSLPGSYSGSQAGKVLADVLADTAELQSDDVPGLIAALNDLSAAQVNAEVDTAITDAALATAAALATVDNIIDAILVDTNELQGDWTNGGRLDLIIDAILADTAELQGDDVPGLIAALNNLSAAQVNAEVVDALATDTYAEPGSVPAATATLAAKIGWLAALARNKVTQTATVQALRNDADGADVATAAVSDDGSEAVRGKWTS